MNSLNKLDQDGFAPLTQLVSATQLTELRAEAERLATAEADRAHGIRDLLAKSKLIREFAASETCLSVLPAGLSVVRGILFDKTEDANWKVTWHQDLTIAVSEKHDVPGYGPWSTKHGAPHVQPPIALLEAMTTIRLHLDDTPATCGALRVIPCSHSAGRLTAEQIKDWRDKETEHVCELSAGDAMLMKPLLLHASSAAEHPQHRRVIHLEYAPTEKLHPLLRWHIGIQSPMVDILK